MLKKVNPVLPSRTAKSNGASGESFSTTSCLRDAASEAGSRGAGWASATSAIEPGSGPRNWSLKTRMEKKELAAVAKWSVAGLAMELISFNRLRSRSHCNAAVFDNHFLKRAGRRRRSFFVWIGQRNFLSCSRETEVAAERNRYRLFLT